MISGARVPRATRVAVVLSALALSVAGCGGAGSDPLASGPSSAASPESSEEPGQVAEATPTPTEEPDPASDPAMASFYKQKLVWVPCGGVYQCSKLKVPLDYSKPDEASLKL